MSSTRTSSPVPATTTGRRLRAAGWSLQGVDRGRGGHAGVLAGRLRPRVLDRSRGTRALVEILALMADGLGNAAIGQRLGLRPKTVRNYVSNVLTKIQAADRADAVLRARSAGLGDGRQG